MGIIGKSKSRDRRPTLSELDLLMRHFVDRSKRDPNAALIAAVCGVPPVAVIEAAAPALLVKEKLAGVNAPEVAVTV